MGLYWIVPGLNRHNGKGEREKERKRRKKREKGRGGKVEGEMAFGGPLSPLPSLSRRWALSQTEIVETRRVKRKERKEGMGGKEKKREKRPLEAI